MNDDRIHESVIELVPSSVSPCDCCSRISISLNLSNYEITVGCYDEFDVLDSCGMLPFERNAYRLKLNTNSIRKPSSIESDFSSHDQGTFKRDSSLNFEDILGYERSEIIVLIVFVIFLLFVNCLLPYYDRLSLIHYLNVIIMGLSIVYIGFVLSQVGDLPSWAKTWLKISFCLFFDGIFMCYIDTKYGTAENSGLYGMMSIDGVVLFLIGLCQYVNELRGMSSYGTFMCCGIGTNYEHKHETVLMLFLIILLFLNRLTPFSAQSSFIGYLGVSIVGLLFFFPILMMLHNSFTAWMNVCLTIELSLCFDSVMMLFISMFNFSMFPVYGFICYISVNLLLVTACVLKLQ